jgi:hypothetical protein
VAVIQLGSKQVQARVEADTAAVPFFSPRSLGLDRQAQPLAVTSLGGDSAVVQPMWCEGSLVVQLLSGQGLTSAVGSGGLLGRQEPFVTLQLVDCEGTACSSHSTKPLKAGGSNPRWTEDAVLDLSYSGFLVGR